MEKRSIYLKRLSEIAKKMGLTATAFCQSCDIDKNLLSSKQEEITSKNLVPILKRYPTINLYWVLLGEGEMFLNDNDLESLSMNRFFLEEYKKLQIEVRQLIAENAVLKSSLQRNIETEYK